MPLLHRRPFVPNPPPEDISPSDEVFFCPLTKEVFIDYEQFFERTILCNSLVWSCSITERGNMTYQEALDYENSARKKFQKFPKELQKPMLLLVKLMSRSRIEELNDAIFSFIKKRYFIGEQLEVKVKTNKFETCRVLDVFPTKPITDPEINGHINGGLSSDEEDDDKPLAKFVKVKHLEPNEVTYQVKISGANLNPIRTVPWSALRRRIRREQCKIFLKRTCVQDPDANRVYIVKDEMVKKLALESLKWEDVFAGPTPVFSGHSPRSRKAAERDERRIDKKSLAKAKDEIRKTKKEKVREETTLLEVKKHEKEMRLEIKKKEAEEAKRLKQIATEQRKKDYREKVERMREVKKRLAEYKKEWNKHRDDLECDDLKEIPPPREIVTRIPPHLFGNVLCLLEFFHTFEGLFDAKDEFPRGVSLGLFEKAIMDENQDGPMCDLLFFFLSNLFRTHTEEEGEKVFVVEEGDKELADHAKDDPSYENLIASATLTATWPKKYQGCSLSNLELDSYTVSEILRLYLLTTAARLPSDSRLWRFQQRGGYCITDDTALRMCLDRPELVQKLATTSIFNFTPDEKVEILTCLTNHLLSFVTPRDYLDDMAEKYLAALQDYREDKRSEKKREKDSVLDRIKWKNAQAIYQKELKLKHQENKLKAKENNMMNSDSPVEENRVTDETGEVVKLMTSEEQKEHLKMLDEEERVAKEAWHFRQAKHLEDIAQYRRFKVLPLGEDRFFRRYWSMNCVPGLLVEEYPDEYLTDDLLKVRVSQGGQFPWTNRKFSPTRVPNNSAATPTETNGMARITGSSIKSEPSATNVSPTFAKTNGVSPDYIKTKQMTQSNVHSPPLNVSRNSTSAGVENQLTPGFSAGSQGKAFKWFIYTEKEDIEKLVLSLNKRGFRESKLYDTLHHAKQRIFSKLSKCPINELCQTVRGVDIKARSKASRTAIELSLRDQILDLESRIFEGTLGIIKEEEGVKWVERITNGGTYDKELRKKLLTSVAMNNGNSDEMDLVEEEEGHRPKKNEDRLIAAPSVRFPLEVEEDDEEEEEEMTEEASVEKMEEGEDSATPIPKVRRSRQEKIQDLALALLQIERGIDRKYLKAPLGYSVDITRRKTRSKGPVDDSEEEIAKRKKESAPYLRRWESSLIKCTSLSQVSLHLSTLNKCIIWARSVLNASCRICHRRGDADKMLLCDSCDRGHHMYCLKPALKSVPIGDWFCPQCKPIHSNRISPRKVRTTSYTQEASSEEDEDTEADETEEEEEDEEDEDEGTGKDSDDEDESSQEEDDEDEEPSPPKRGLRYKFPTRPTRTSTRERKPRNLSPEGVNTRTRGRSAGRAESSRVFESQRRGRSASERRQAMKRNASNEEDYDQPGSSSSRRRSTGVWKDLNTCQELLRDLIQHKDSWPFLMPVSKKQVPDYYDIIKNPMDFSTMQNKFKNIGYGDPTEFISDVKLVFSNCLTYNMPRSVHAKAAVQLGNYFEKKIRENGLDRYKDAPPDPPTKKRKS